MTVEKLNAANDIVKQIIELEALIKNCKNQKCEWIEFTFGNGSNKAIGCNDKEFIEDLRDVIIEFNESKLEMLKSKLDNL